MHALTDAVAQLVHRGQAGIQYQIGLLGDWAEQLALRFDGLDQRPLRAAQRVTPPGFAVTFEQRIRFGLKEYGLDIHTPPT